MCTPLLPRLGRDGYPAEVVSSRGSTSDVERAAEISPEVAAPRARSVYHGAMNPQRSSQSQPRPMCEAHAHHVPPDTAHCAAHVPLAGGR